MSLIFKSIYIYIYIYIYMYLYTYSRPWDIWCNFATWFKNFGGRLLSRLHHNHITNENKSSLLLTPSQLPPVAGVECAHRFPACLKGCLDGSLSTAWDYTSLQCNLYRYAGPKRSCAQSPRNHSYTWCNMLLTGLHHSPVVSIPLLLPSNSPPPPYMHESWGQSSSSLQFF